MCSAIQLKMVRFVVMVRFPSGCDGPLCREGCKLDAHIACPCTTWGQAKKEREELKLLYPECYVWLAIVCN